MKKYFYFLKKWLIRAPVFYVLQLLSNICTVRLSLTPIPSNGYVFHYKNIITRKSYQLFFDQYSAIQLHFEIEKRLQNKTIKSLDLTFPDGTYGDNPPIIYVPCWVQKKLNQKLERSFAAKYIVSQNNNQTSNVLENSNE